MSVRTTGGGIGLMAHGEENLKILIVLRKIAAQVFHKPFVQSGERLENTNGNGLFQRFWP
jgi:hypothetical protein